MDNLKKILTVLGLGISIGVILVIIVIYYFNLNPTGFNLGPVEFEMPSTSIIIQETTQTIQKQPTSSLISKATQSNQQSSGGCQEAGGENGFPLSKKPSAPSNGCVLIVEWWVPPDSANCGIIITMNTPSIPDEAIGSWWYVYPQLPDIHKQLYLAKHPQCKVLDLR